MQKKLIIIGITILGIVFSCTKLDTEPYSKLLKENYVPTAGQIGSLYVAPVYLRLHAITGSNQSNSRGDIYQDQSFCTDEALTPRRIPGDWYDGGHFWRLFEHTWTAELEDLITLWTICWDIVTTANQNIYNMEQSFPGQSALTKPFADEIKVIRSLGYYYMIDLFGNVPIVTKLDTTNTAVGNHTDFATGRKMLFDTIVNDLWNSIPSLSTRADQYTFGTFNKYAAFALLAKMYINAEVWTGTAMWDECIAVCDSIISSGRYSLSSDYFANFKQENQESRENILVVPYNQNSSELFEGFYFMSLHYQSYMKYRTAGAAWNGFCALPDHYHSFDSIDVRREGWSTGLQLAADGITPTLCIRAPYAGQPVIFTPDFVDAYNPSDPYNGDTLLYTNTLENSGARLVKYEIAAGLPRTCLGVPLPLFRYSDILLLKAEALMRNNGGDATAEAVGYVNQVRGRAGVGIYDEVTLTLDELLAERGRELYYEGIRRQDLVRFGKFVRGTWGRNFSGGYQAQWYDRSGEDDSRNVFPLPAMQINLNPLLNQNPGY